MLEPSNKIQDSLRVIEQAPSLLKLTEAFRSAVDDYGYESFLCSAPPRPGEEGIDPVLFGAWPEDWRQRYTERRYYVRDPMLQELYRTADAFTWRTILNSRRYSEADRKIVFDAAAWGMREGFVIPLYGIGGQVHAITMAGPTPRIDSEARSELLLMSIYAYGRAKRLAGRQLDPVPLLKPREREALQWVAAGKGDWEIGQIMGISESAAHKHVENAKRKIGVSTRVQAVVEAIRTGQLHL
ncbi:MAG: hypothetical protein HOP13_20865 [Alphaproteobacteria bacterium]|nr:hypothetical protein [Alphaproteobacteria bacterium]